MIFLIISHNESLCFYYQTLSIHQLSYNSISPFADKFENPLVVSGEAVLLQLFGLSQLFWFFHFFQHIQIFFFLCPTIFQPTTTRISHHRSRIWTRLLKNYLTLGPQDIIFLLEVDT